MHLTHMWHQLRYGMCVSSCSLTSSSVGLSGSPNLLIALLSSTHRLRSISSSICNASSSSLSSSSSSSPSSNNSSRLKLTCSFFAGTSSFLKVPWPFFPWPSPLLPLLPAPPIPMTAPNGLTGFSSPALKKGLHPRTRPATHTSCPCVSCTTCLRSRCSV